MTEHTQFEVLELLCKDSKPKASQNIIYTFALVSFAYASDLVCSCSHIYFHAIQVCIAYSHWLAATDVLQQRANSV